MFSKSSKVCLCLLTFSVGLLSAAIEEVPNHLADASSDSGMKWMSEDGEKQEMLGTFIQVDKSKVDRRENNGGNKISGSDEHVGEVTDVAGTYTASRVAEKDEKSEHYSNNYGREPVKSAQNSEPVRSSQDGTAARNTDGFHPMLPILRSPTDLPESEATSLQEPPRTGRDYPVSGDNYGWTYPSSSGAASTGGGSASYYPSAEYGKPAPAVDSKYYSWAAPGAGDDKYKRPSYFTYTVNQGGAPVECIPIPMAGIITEMTKGGSDMTGKNSILRVLLQALAWFFVIKIPIMLALKALVFKLLILPGIFVTVALPVLMPILYFFLPSFMKDKDKDKTTTKPPTMVMMMTNPNSTARSRGLYIDDPLGGRRARTLFREDGSVTEDFEELLRNLIGEQNCVEKMACQFGVRDAQSQYRKPISWVLKYVQTLPPVVSDPTLRVKLKMYREAYNFGADIAASNGTAHAHNPDLVCSDTLYPCQKPQVIVKQARTLYKLV